MCPKHNNYPEKKQYLSLKEINKIPIKNFLDEKNVDLLSKGKNIHCQSLDHEDKNPSSFITSGNRVRCSSCKSSMSVTDIIMHRHRCSLSDVPKIVCEFYLHGNYQEKEPLQKKEEFKPREEISGIDKINDEIYMKLSGRFQKWRDCIPNQLDYLRDHGMCDSFISNIFSYQCMFYSTEMLSTPPFSIVPDYARAGIQISSMIECEKLVKKHHKIEKNETVHGILARYNIKHGENYSFLGSVLFPLTDLQDPEIPKSYICRRINSKDKTKWTFISGSKKKSELFYAPRFNITNKDGLVYRHSSIERIEESKSCILVEGPCDALAVFFAGFSNVLAINTSSISPYQANSLKSIGVKNILLLLDNDEAGRSGSDNIKKILDNSCPGHFSVSNLNKIYEKIEQKDPAELLRKRGALFLKNLILKEISPVLEEEKELNGIFEDIEKKNLWVG